MLAILLPRILRVIIEVIKAREPIPNHANFGLIRTIVTSSALTLMENELSTVRFELTRGRYMAFPVLPLNYILKMEPCVGLEPT